MKNNIAEDENDDWMEELVCYTDKQQNILNNIHQFIDSKHILNKIIAKGDLWCFTTKDGIQEQLNNFVLSHGIIYFVAFDNDVPIVLSKSVKLKNPYSLKEIV